MNLNLTFNRSIKSYLEFMFTRLGCIAQVHHALRRDPVNLSAVPRVQTQVSEILSDASCSKFFVDINDMSAAEMDRVVKKMSELEESFQTLMNDIGSCASAIENFDEIDTFARNITRIYNILTWVWDAIEKKDTFQGYCLLSSLNFEVKYLLRDDLPGRVFPKSFGHRDLACVFDYILQEPILGLENVSLFIASLKGGAYFSFSEFKTFLSETSQRIANLMNRQSGAESALDQKIARAKRNAIEKAANEIICKHMQNLFEDKKSYNDLFELHEKQFFEISGNNISSLNRRYILLARIQYRLLRTAINSN